MKVTKVWIQLVNERNLKAFVNVEFDAEMIVHSIKIIETQGKRFLQMPNRRNNEGGWRDIVHPLHQEFRDKLEEAIYPVYEKEKTNAEKSD